MVCCALTNDHWRDRWERLCLRSIEDDELEERDPERLDTRAWAERDARRAQVEQEAERWRRDGGFHRAELNVTRLDETERLVALAADWLELDSHDEGIRFDSELVSRKSCIGLI